MLTFDGATSDSYGLLIVSIKRDMTPTVNNKFIEVSGYDGAYFAGSSLGTKTIEVEVEIIATDENDLRDKARSIGGWLYTEDEVPFSFSDEPDLIYRGKIDENSLEEVLHVGTGTIKFICGKPTADGALRSVTLGNVTTLTVAGTAKAYPLFTFTVVSNTDELKIENDNGDYLRLATPLINGDTVIIDCSTGKVTINGLVRMPTLDLLSVFFPLKGGQNTLTLTPSNTFNGTVKYNEQWI